jgi:hypothetical protein
MKVMREMTTINKEINNHHRRLRNAKTLASSFAPAAGLTMHGIATQTPPHCAACRGEAIRVLLTIAREERTGHTWRGQSTREMKQGGWQHSEQQLAGCMTAGHCTQQPAPDALDESRDAVDGVAVVCQCAAHAPLHLHQTTVFACE